MVDRASWVLQRVQRGPVGLSTNHCLAIVNRGGARAADIQELAQHIKTTVTETFGVELTPEPTLLGF